MIAPLIDKNDSTMLGNVREAKNAIFYKDMLAFYDAYQKLFEVEDKTYLPNYILWNGKYSLEGICLFMKDYSSVLGFESLSLSLSYLKILYYTLASYSIGANMPERSVIEEEFEAYKSQIQIAAKTTVEESERVEGEYSALQADYSKKSRSNIKNKTLSSIFNVLSILFLSVGIFCVIAPFALYFFSSLKLLFAFIISLGCIAVGVVLFIIFRKLSKAYDSRENGTAYEVQRSKKFREEKLQNHSELLSKRNRILCERYECLNNLNKILFSESADSFEDILKSASEYSILSYNIKHDCIVLFKNQEEDIKNILGKLSKPTKIEDAPKRMNELYKEIKQKDWLFYNNLVRLSYLNKYVELAEKSFTWQLEGEKNKMPFNVNVKKIAKEQIAFLKNRDALFVSSTIDKFANTNYLKKQDIFKLKHNLNVSEVQDLKIAYSTKFYDYDAIKDYNNIFYDRKIGAGAKVPQEIIDKYSKIPTLIYLKLRLLEMQTGLDNSDSEMVYDVKSNLFAEDEKMIQIFADIQAVEVKENAEKKTIYECDEMEEIDDKTVKYNFSDSSTVGYKII